MVQKTLKSNLNPTNLKLFIFILFLTIANLKSYCQDLIYLKNNSNIKAHITEINDETVYYKKYENLTGPEYTIAKNEILLIRFQDGESILFDNSNSFENNSKNVLSFNFGDLTVGRVGISYERFIINQRLSFQIPLSISYNYNNQNYSYNYKFLPKLASGFNVNFYPLGLGIVSYYTGIGAQTGVINQWSYTPHTDSTGYTYYSTSTVEKKFIGVYINNGIAIIPSKHFSISGLLGIGFRNIEGAGHIKQSVIGQLNISYRF